MIIGNKKLTTKIVVRVARFNEKIELHSDAIKRIKKCRNMIEEKIISGEIIYGINTGIGEFSEVVLDEGQLQEFQKYLIYNHAAGIGDPAPIEYIRGAMLSRINAHAKGQSGCRIEITPTLCIQGGDQQYMLETAENASYVTLEKE